MRGRVNCVISDLDMFLRVLTNTRTQLPGQHLRAEANAEKRLVFSQSDRNPIGLDLDEIVGVVGAHRTAENHGPRMMLERLRQRITKPRPANIEPVAIGSEPVSDVSRIRVFLMQDDDHAPAGMRDWWPCDDIDGC